MLVREESSQRQSSTGTRLALDAETDRSIRRRRPYGTLDACRPPSPVDGTILDVAPRLLHSHAGERPDPTTTEQLVDDGQLGGGTVQIGDPSGRTTARTRQGADVQSMNIESIHRQLEKLWVNVKCLGIKHKFPEYISRRKDLLNNRVWLEKLNAVELMRDLGSGMRLGEMLARDS